MAKETLRGFIQHLDALIAIAELGSFRKAARSLNLHQSVLSRRIRDLEDELGISLFQRSPNGVRLTNAGQIYIEQMKIGHRFLEEAVRQATAAGRSQVGFVRVGFYSFLATGFLHDLLETYSKSHPGVSIDLAEADYVELVSRVRAQSVDIAFVAQEHRFDDCDTLKLWTERLLLCVPEQDPLAELSEVNWSQMQSKRFIVRAKASGPQIAAELTKVFQQHGYVPDLDAQDVSREMLMDLVRLGRGVTFTNEAALGSPFAGINMIPIKDYALRYYAVWSPENDNPALRRFLSMARELSAKRYPGLVRSA
jgi:DNA-binding transcriptional LysR family regulator